MRTVWLLFRKDLLSELRTRALAGSMLVFVVVVVVVMSLVTERAEGYMYEARMRAVSALLWLTLLFAGVLGLARNFAGEAELGAWQGLLLTPAARGALYLGKVASGTFFVVVSDSGRVWFTGRSWGRALKPPPARGTLNV